MSKRYEKPYDYNFSTPSKKPKLDVTISASQRTSRNDKQPSTSRDREDNFDPWGDDFNEDEIKEIDFAASQTITEDTSVGVVNGVNTPKASPEPPSPAICSYLNTKPSTSRSNAGSSAKKKYEFKAPSNLSQSRKDSGQVNNGFNSPVKVDGVFASNQRQAQPSQVISSSVNKKEMFKNDQTILFDDFKDNLMDVENHNSTFQSQIINKMHNGSNKAGTNVPTRTDAINVSDDSILRQFHKLQLENEKLRNNFLTNEGETAYLRNKLLQTVNRAEKDQIEGTRRIEEQANQHRSEINLAIKKEVALRTQLEFQTLQLNNLKERCKLLESGAVKLTQPHTARLDSANKNRLNTTLNRSSSTVKTIQVTESGVQTASLNVRQAYRLRKKLEIHPLSRIPQSIFEASHVEPSVIEIQVIERVGTKNLPILQDEENIRIFENPDLVKPIVTIVNGQKLNIEFCAPDVALLMKRTEREINSHSIIPVINKLVSVARELLLNTTLVLQRISQVMKNDDIRDMNDVYFSDFYKMHVDSTKSICDSNAWHDRERGIEARRSLGILCYTSLASNYLSQYIAGAIRLNSLNDSNYENYIKDMNSYNNWSKKGTRFEMLELILEFVSTIGYVRRSHQFTGLIIAIAKLLINVKDRLVADEKAIDYISKILKEIIFSRPLLICYVYITQLLTTFSQCIQFCRKLCVTTNKSAMSIFKDELHFTSDACTMQIYIAQLEVCQPDPVEIIDITYALVCFVSNILSLNDITWINHPGTTCKCSMKLFGLTLNFLHKCSKVNIEESVWRPNYDYITNFEDRRNEFHLSNDTSQAIIQSTRTSSPSKCFETKPLDKDVKRRSKDKQLLALRKGIMFLCYLSTRDPDFIIKSTEIEDSFNLFMQQIDSFDNLKLDKTEQAALSKVKSTFSCDKITSSEERSDKAKRCCGLKKHFGFKNKLSASNRQQIMKLYGESNSGNHQTSDHLSWLLKLTKKKKN